MTKMASSSQTKDLSDLAQMRIKTEGYLSGLWLLTALVSYFLWAGFAVAWWLGSLTGASDIGFVLELLGTLGVVASAPMGYLVYRLVNRCNLHYARTQLFFQTSLEHLELGPSPPPPSVMISASSARDSIVRLIRNEHHRSGVLWGLLCMVPIAGWVFLLSLLSLLSSEVSRHARLEGLVLEDVDRTIKASGRAGVTGGTILIRSRSPLGYVVLGSLFLELLFSILIGVSGYLLLGFLTLGAFAVLWLDFAIHDPVAHLSNHSSLEDRLIRSTSPLASPITGSA